MNAKFAIAVLLAFASSRCEASPCGDSGPEDGEMRDLEETDRELSTGDVLEDMLDYIIAEDDIFEGRKKKKKKKLLKFLAGALLLKAILLPKLFALIKFLTAKAYLVSLLAFIFAASVTSKNHDSSNTEHIINLVAKGNGGNARALHGQEQAFRYWRRREPVGV